MWRRFAVCMGLWAPLLAGCSCFNSWRTAGSSGAVVDAQRRAAVAHDPYASDAIGPPIVGGRPRDYQRELPEAERSQPQVTGWAH